MKSMSNTPARRIVELLLDPLLFEATVRRPPRSRRWVAVFTGPEPGKQVWRSTGLTGRSAALALARRWEEQARRQRAATGALTQEADDSGPARQRGSARGPTHSERGGGPAGA